MSVSQVSVFIESRPGHLHAVLADFARAGVQIRGYCASDTGDYGIVRFVVDKPDVAMRVLQEAGAAAKRSEVLCLRLPDAPGELARVMGVIAERGVNVVYSYSLMNTFIALSVEDLENAERLLSTAPVQLVSQADLAEPGIGVGARAGDACADEAHAGQEGR